MAIADFKGKMNELKRNISMLKIYAQYFADDDYRNDLDQYIKDINEDRFQMLVVGEFSRGKSTLINALLGKALIPSSRNPTTATLNVIKNGVKDEYNAFYYDGRRRKMTLEEFKKVIAVEDIDLLGEEEWKSRQAEINKIHFMEIRTPNPFGELGVDIIDTPGVNDLNREREKITFDYIPKADSAIILLAANELLSASELEFITKNILESQVTKLFVAINFKDDIKDENDQKRILDECIGKLSGIVPKERIFLVSAKEALKYRRREKGETVKNCPDNIESTGLPEFETAVLDYLSDNIGKIKINRFANRISVTTENFVQTTIERKLQSILLSVDDLQKQIGSLSPELNRQKIKCSNCLQQLRNSLEQDEEGFAEELKKALYHTAEKARDTVETYQGNDPEELLHSIRRATYRYEKNVRYDIPEKHKKQIYKHVESTLEQIKDLCPDIPLDVNEFVDIQPSVVGQINPGALNSITYDEVYCKEKYAEEGKLALGRLAGGVLIAGAAIAIAASGGWILGLGAVAANGVKMIFDDSGYDEIEEKYADTKHLVANKKSMHDVFMSEIKREYFDGIDDQVSRYRDGLRKGTEMLIKHFETEYTSKADNVLKQMENELNDKVNRTNTAKEEYDKAVEKKKEILRIMEKLEDISHEFG